MARSRTTKGVAKRIDLHYFQKPHPWRTGRAAVVFLVAAAAIVWAAFHATAGRGEMIYNPGHLAASHAMIEHDCAACHDGVGADGRKSGRFSKAVSDTACLKCHDAAIHHENQATLVSTDGARSADCTHCHIEHRGQAALVGADDAHCLQCHSNLDSSLVKRPTAPGVWTKVTAFDLSNHPHFGRKLVRGAGGAAPEWSKAGDGGWALKSGTWFDPTVLRFNHKKHPTSVVPAAGGESTNCTVCHSTTPQPAHELSADPTVQAPPPPWTPPRDASAASAGFRPPPVDQTNSADRRYTRQISYERDCVGCHRLDLIGEDGKPVATIPHVEMSLVRAKIAALPDADLNKLFAPPGAAKPAAPAEPSAPDLGDADPLPRPVVRERAGVRVIFENQKSLRIPNHPHPNPLPEGEGTKATALQDHRAREAALILAADDDPLAGPEPAPTASASAETVNTRMIGKWKKRVNGDAAAQLQKLAAVLPKPSGADAGKQAIDRRLVQFYVAYVASSNCMLCHDITGDAAKGFSTSASNGPVTGISTDADALRTVPTGIPPTARRWFVSSNFDHDAHRDMTCVQCHAKALTSSETADVLSPDIDGTFRDADGKVEPPDSGSKSCVECHHPTANDIRGAEPNCAACHAYHDRTLERVRGPSAPLAAAASAR